MRTTLIGLLFASLLSAQALARKSAEDGQAAQIKAQIPANLPNDWDQGIQPIGQVNYYKAIDCGKQGGDNPVCLFYDAGLCKNEDFELSLYSPYKFVAYEVWNAVRQKKPAPQPSYSQAGRTPLTIGIAQVKG